MEFEQFKLIALPKIAKRIQLHDIRLPDEYKMVRSGGAAGTASDHARKPSTVSQEAVVAYLLQRNLESLPGVSVYAIAEQTLTHQFNDGLRLLHTGR